MRALVRVLEFTGMLLDRLLIRKYQESSEREKTHRKNGRFWGSFWVEESQGSSRAFLELFKIGEDL